MMEATQAMIEAVESVFPMFGMPVSLVNEEYEDLLWSANQVNALVSFNDSLKGNVVVGLSRRAALKIAAAMMGGGELLTLDNMAKSALVEAVNMLAGSMLCKFNSVDSIYYPPPTLVIGDNLSLMFGRVKSKKLEFQMQNDRLSVAFFIE